MEDIVSPRHGRSAGLQVSYVADVEFDFMCDVRILGLVLVTHIVLLLLVTAEDAYLTDVGAQEAVQHRIAKRTSSARNQQRLVFKNTYIYLALFDSI